MLEMTLASLSDENDLISWSVFQEKSGQISVRIRFEAANDAVNHNADYHKKVKRKRMSIYRLTGTTCWYSDIRRRLCSWNSSRHRRHQKYTHDLTLESLTNDDGVHQYEICHIGHLNVQINMFVQKYNLI